MQINYIHKHSSASPWVAPYSAVQRFTCRVEGNGWSLGSCREQTKDYLYLIFLFFFPPSSSQQRGYYLIIVILNIVVARPERATRRPPLVIPLIRMTRPRTVKAQRNVFGAVMWVRRNQLAVFGFYGC